MMSVVCNGRSGCFFGFLVLFFYRVRAGVCTASSTRISILVLTCGRWWTFACLDGNALAQLFDSGFERLLVVR